MNNDNYKIQTFTDLVAWKEGHKLVLFIYKITDKFPQKELYALTSQIRRAAVSITSNIAEGFSRNSYKEKIQFFYVALGSLTELQNQLIIAKDIDYIDNVAFDKLSDSTITVSKLINGLIKSLKNHNT